MEAPQEIKSTGWWTLQHAGEIHVVPAFGPKHELNDSCWCHPQRDDVSPRMVVHNVLH